MVGRNSRKHFATFARYTTTVLCLVRNQRGSRVHLAIFRHL